ncbi:MAG: hypothetical protein JSW60_08910 [Thermoplasmatales archaeon]|nr:MAG: hypothetical protein JSW60_08910 [Thermoplasmatales archaeon]
MQKPLLKKGIAVAVILLFIGLAFAPSINADVDTLENLTTPLINSPEETTALTIRYYTLRGVKELKKEVTLEKAGSLFTLMDGNDYNAIAKTLDGLELTPKSMDVKDVIELINGDVGQREFSQYEGQLQEVFINDNESEWKQNILCYIRGDAVDSYFYRPIAFMIEYGAALVYTALLGILFTLDTLFRIFPWYPVGDPPFEFGPLMMLALMLGVAYMALFEGWPLHYLVPVKIAPIVLANLDDAFGRFQTANLSTTGLNGHWEIHDNRSIALLMVGFLGIWISYKDGYQVPACEFMGFSLYTKAKGYNY